ncbi:type 2 isopentenyl-diphosphate Delta-isomerase [Methanohalophilus profundi]|uniref:type 2 isopentenyl-diphosphate Delta-isomerase n=1 Tax=Methanohalophilus profundi TaxID=2138083 RepID=UPI00101DDFC1|nr:type 2 isopentenyl-diphosphate Delta-isomerase [Methanohalophilus profundi]
MFMSTSSRKLEHMQLCAQQQVESRKAGPGFKDVKLVPRALPEMDMDSVDISTSFLGKKMDAPFMIASITGGHPDTTPVNAALAEAAEETGIGIGVGSQRAAIEDTVQEESFSVVRDKAPNAFVYGNIGAAQVKEYGIEGAEKLVEMLDADALAVHLNFLQEAIQPEGDRDATGCINAIEEICSIDVPIIVKETGAGISREDALHLKEAGVAAIDVGGAGGTSWAGVEVYRAKQRGDRISGHLGELFWDFGIPTIPSLIECRVSLPLIATGGVRTGLDIAKSLALGANMASAALPFVAPALKEGDSVKQRLELMFEELKVAMFLCGCPDIESLRTSSSVVLQGETLEYLNQRGFDIRDIELRSKLL